MHGRSYAVVVLDEVERYPAMSGAPVLMPVRRRLEVSAFGINCWTAPVGAPVIERHSEPDGDEGAYLVVRGRVRFTVDDDTFEAGPATLVHVRPNTLREAIATESETLVLAVGAKPGEAFEPKSWEDFQIAFAEAYARGEEVVKFWSSSRDEGRKPMAKRHAPISHPLSQMTNHDHQSQTFTGKSHPGGRRFESG